MVSMYNHGNMVDRVKSFQFSLRVTCVELYGIINYISLHIIFARIK